MEPAHRSDIAGFPRASLILEAHAHLMKFLRNVVAQILEGVDLDKPASTEKWIAMTKLGFKECGDVEFWSPYTYQPFSAPPIFSIDALLSSARTRLNATEDHLWLLQTEPSYIWRHIGVLNEGAIMKSRGEDTYVMIVRELVHDAKVYWWWQWVMEECENVRTQYSRFKDNIHPGERLPPKYDKALGALELLLVNLMHCRSKHLQAVIPQRPGF